MEEMPLKAAAPGVGQTAAPAPPTFQASMVRDAAVGALICIVIGLVLLAIPGMPNLNSWMITALSSVSPDIGMYAGAILSVPTTSDPATPLSVIKFLYAAFLMFPSNLGWFVGGILVSSVRVRRGRDEGNIKPGWDLFWYGLVSVEIPFMIFGVIFLLSSLNPALMVLQGFSGSVLLYFLLMFLMPMFWMALILALLGSLIGSAVAKKAL